jgi:hypothetical protein
MSYVWSINFGTSDSEENARERTDGLYVSRLESIHVEALVRWFSLKTISVRFVHQEFKTPRLDIPSSRCAITILLHFAYRPIMSLCLSSSICEPTRLVHGGKYIMMIIIIMMIMKTEGEYDNNNIRSITSTTSY